MNRAGPGGELVDAHVHVFGPVASGGGPARGVDELVPSSRSAEAEELLAVMDAHQVDRAVLVALDPYDGDVARALREHPQRFAAVAVANPEELRPTAPPLLAGALEVRRRTLPFAGLRTTWLGEEGRSVADSPAMPLLRWCADAGVVLWAYLPPGQFDLLDAVCSELPDLQVALNHFGFSPDDMHVDAHRRPWFAERLPASRVEEVCVLARHPGVHVLVSGHYALSHEDPPYADLFSPTARYLDAFGADRLMWGSDFPWPVEVPGYGALLTAADAALSAAGATAAERALVMGGSAARLLSISKET